MNEIDAIAFLLERGIGFDQFDLLGAYKSDCHHFIDGVEHPYLVQFGDNIATQGSFEEASFKTAREAAEFFMQKCRDGKLNYDPEKTEEEIDS